MEINILTKFSLLLRHCLIFYSTINFNYKGIKTELKIGGFFCDYTETCAWHLLLLLLTNFPLPKKIGFISRKKYNNFNAFDFSFVFKGEETEIMKRDIFGILL